MENETTKKHDYIAIVVFVIILALDSRYSALTTSFASLEYFVSMVTSLLIIYVVGIPLSFFMAKSHIISAQYFWRWANVSALLVIFLMLKWAM
ncbi:MAG: hypothetical protein US25_C0042G0004 [Candidatus Moranbacteria bacterium GW2011_GWE1_36_7]|nr:MAG: hypothetical protein UR99_C0055G0004 [Candidatus Moranbacteria bacterium GW2011_GWD2_36_12]KKQ13135.1 MAG: hypothetical protein US25_C0042G0004 [Candidatus Moranbacteria bacterium GW2011_GWE1_36_7]